MPEKEQNSSSSVTPPVQTPPAQPTETKPKQKFSLKLVVAAVLVVCLAVVGGLYAWMTTGNQQKVTTTDKVYHIGILSGLDFFLDSTESFKKEMANLGYVEGKNIVYEFEQSNIEEDKEKKSLQKFIADKVDVVFSYPTEPSIIAKTELKNSKIPLVFTGAFVEQGGLIDSVSNPGPYVTGVRYPGPDVAAKRLEILHELAPTAKKVWLPFLDGYPPVAKELEAVQPIAKSLGIELILFPAKGPADLEKELNARSARGNIGIDAILLIPEPLAVTGNSFFIMDKFATTHKIPLGGTYLPDSNSLFGYNPDNAEMGALAAPLVDKILKGTSPNSLAVVTPEAYLYFNYKAAKALGLTVSDSFLSRAKVIIR